MSEKYNEGVILWVKKKVCGTRNCQKAIQNLGMKRIINNVHNNQVTSNQIIGRAVDIRQAPLHHLVGLVSLGIRDILDIQVNRGIQDILVTQVLPPIQITQVAEIIQVPPAIQVNQVIQGTDTTHSIVNNKLLLWHRQAKFLVIQTRIYAQSIQVV